MPILWGIGALAYFTLHPELFDSGAPAVEAMPRFLAIILPVGVIGIVVAGMVAADMSTYNSYLLAWSGIITQDVIAPLVPGGMSDKARLLTNRVVILLCGLFILWMGLVYEAPATFIQYQQLSGAIYLSGAVACVVFGLYWKRANTAGAIAATLVGTMFPIANLYFHRHIDRLPGWMKSEIITDWLTEGWMSGVTAFAAAILTMIVVSLITARWVRPRMLPVMNNGLEEKQFVSSVGGVAS